MLDLKCLLSAFLMLAVVLSGCGSDSSHHSAPDPEIVIDYASEKGIFDPSLAYDAVSGRIYMAYSEVNDSVMWPGQNDTVQTRLAWSADSGATWTDTGTTLNTALDVTLPLAPPNDAGTWNHEVPELVYDPGAPVNERWKLFWHHYLWMNHIRMFDHGWLALITAPAPEGPWSAERKLFVGSFYNTADDAIIGPPEVQLDQLHADLNDALIFTEPGALATSDTLYVILLAAAAAPGDGRIVLVRWVYGVDTWEYCGTFLVNSVEGPAMGWDGFSAPELVEADGTVYLLVTPQNSDIYLGTYVFTVTDLDTASLQRTGGVPDVKAWLPGPDGYHTGAAGYCAEAAASGIIYSKAEMVAPLFFQIFSSGVNL